MATIYVITNKINGKQYVGATDFALKKRFKEHCHDAKSDRCKDRPLYSDMNKYGAENFAIEELENCSTEDKFNRETYWINKLDTHNNGYNYTFGGSGKQFYDYKMVSNKYLELGTVRAVCDALNCDPYTVRVACQQYDIDIASSNDVNKRIYSKAVDMLNKYTEELLRTFSSLTEAALFLGDESKRRHIFEVCNGKKHRNTAYGYKWRWHNDHTEEEAS